MEEDNFVSVENRFASLEEAQKTRSRTNIPGNTPSYKTSTFMYNQGKSNRSNSHRSIPTRTNTTQSSTNVHHIPTQTAHGNKNSSQNRPTSLYGQLYLQPLKSDYIEDNYDNDQEPSFCSYSSSSFDLQREENDGMGRVSPALTHLEDVTEASRSLIDADLLKRHGIGRPGITKSRMRRRGKYRKRKGKQMQHSQKVMLKVEERNSRKESTVPRDCATFSRVRAGRSLPEAPSLAPFINEGSNQGNVTRVPSPALTHLEDVTEVSRALIPTEFFEFNRKKRDKNKKKKRKKKKNTKAKKVTNEWAYSQARCYRNQSALEDDEDSIGFPPIIFADRPLTSFPVPSTSFRQLSPSSNRVVYKQQEQFPRSSEVEEMMTLENENSCEMPIVASLDEFISPRSEQKKEVSRPRVSNEAFSLEDYKEGMQSQRRRIHQEQHSRTISSLKQSRQPSVKNEEKQSFDAPLDQSKAKDTKHYSSLMTSPPKCISSEPLPISPLCNPPPPSHMYTQVISSKSPHYKGLSKSLSNRAPLAMQIVHELAIGLIDAYRMSGILPQRNNTAERTPKDLQLVGIAEERGEEAKEERATIQSFLRNLDFLVKLVDITCSSDTPAPTRKRLKQHVQFRSLRSAIRTVNSVVSSRFLIERIDRHRLLFRIVLPQKSGLQDVRDEGCNSSRDNAVNDIGVMKELNRSLSEAVRLAIVGKIYLRTPSSPLLEESVNVIGPKSPPAMYRATKPTETKGGVDGQYGHHAQYLPSSPPPFAPYVFRPITEKNRHPCQSPRSRQNLRPISTYVHIAEAGTERSPSRVCDLPIIQDDKTKKNIYAVPSAHVQEIDDASTATSDVHRASTPIWGNTSPRRKMTAFAGKGTTIAKAHEELDQTGCMSKGTSSPPKNGRSEEGLKELVVIIRHLWDERAAYQEKSREMGEESCKKVLFPSEGTCKEKDSIMPTLASSKLPLLFQEKHSHRYHQDQTRDTAISGANKSAEEELEELIEVFRERRRKSEANMEDVGGKQQYTNESLAQRTSAESSNISGAEESMVRDLNLKNIPSVQSSEVDFNDNVERHSFGGSTEFPSDCNGNKDVLKLLAINEAGRNGVTALEPKPATATLEFSTEKQGLDTHFVQHNKQMSARSALHKKRVALRSKSNSDMVREYPNKLYETNAKQPLPNSDYGQYIVNSVGNRKIDVMPTGGLGQQRSESVDLSMIEEWILHLEILKADKESAIDRLTETQSVDAPSFRSGVSSSHDIRRENKEDILERNAGVAALELEVQNLSQRLTSLRKKLRQSTQVEAEAL